VTWTNLLRLDWARQKIEEPKYYEEMSREQKDDVILEIDPELHDLLGDTTLLFKEVSKIDNPSPLLPLSVILGVSLDIFQLKEDDTKITIPNLIKYVTRTKKAIGIINVRDENKVQFVKPNTDIQSVSIIVFLGDKIGILTTNEGESSIPVSSLPKNIEERWINAGIVRFKKPVIFTEAKVPIPLIGEDKLRQESIVLPLNKGKVPVARKKKVPVLVNSPKRKRVVFAEPNVEPAELLQMKPKPKSKSKVKLIEEPVVSKPNKPKSKLKPILVDNALSASPSPVAPVASKPKSKLKPRLVEDNALSAPVVPPVPSIPVPSAPVAPVASKPKSKLKPRLVEDDASASIPVLSVVPPVPSIAPAPSAPVASAPVAPVASKLKSKLKPILVDDSPVLASNPPEPLATEPLATEPLATVPLATEPLVSKRNLSKNKRSVRASQVSQSKAPTSL
jgi:hypothetical protein